MVSGDSGFTLRAVSALAMMPVALGLVILGGWPFACLVGLAVVLMAIEWRDLTVARFGGPGGSLAGASVAGVGLAVVLLAAGGRPFEALLCLFAGALMSGLAAWRLGAAPLWIGLGTAYLAFPALALVWLRGLPQVGLQIVIWLLAVVWTTDILAYLVGRKVGGPRLAPRISPGKTWSGLCGGVAAAALAGGVTAWAIGSERLLQAVGLGGLLAIVSQIGDLIESLLKRRAGVKDSGTLIPGHGGVLDRLDGLVLAAPVLALLGLALGPRAWPWP
ncbi:MAG TPA: phosphatidate cytidylyltransferase [Geminicoccaceae bacterium]|nr:phosphatidate cytidylyltransferase [Geminicoccaceae bacterium]